MWMESRLPDGYVPPQKTDKVAKAPRYKPRVYDNPWKLSEAEKRALQAVIEAGSNAGAASLLNVSLKTVEMQIRHASEKMGTDTRVHLLITWDRYMRGKE
jgi:DNA-binding NarL/FixJ family response regulator